MHEVHAVAPVLLYVPPRHESVQSAVLPVAVPYFPAEHRSQAVAPEEPCHFPAEHDAQLVAPVVLEYFPSSPIAILTEYNAEH